MSRARRRAVVAAMALTLATALLATNAGGTDFRDHDESTDERSRSAKGTRVRCLRPAS